ncbi:1-acyl-sn-glycerol-3-phosphate acyltransferase [Methylophaga frappieri]|uniref:1-acyl-sn-glycerol-3-phosphate acyltransferase n=1 Tax=Methylophaga frappieri (strain ATCC BAA-2434 / DSM 25690 / JAM7) TaxID=754477 RepID=I1YKG5_METFJ|nr:lysophospholipid acyltransferase family protein [Methylophaga frappieri]AFJ03408.1 1-acyl-sn-glycerol-3-phosphate acyltransferase [Methylophaga frappieri]
MTTVVWWAVPFIIIWVIGLLAARADWGGAHVNWLDGWTRILCRCLHGLKQQSLPLPETGGAIVIANHVSGVDPLLLIAASQRPLRFLIAREQYQRFGLQWLFRAAGCIPVDRSGRPEQSLREALAALRHGEIIALFPHGKIHLDHDPPRPIKAGFARLAAWAQVPVTAVRIDGVKAQGSVLLAPWVPDNVQLTHTVLSTADEATLLTAAKMAIEVPRHQSEHT